MSGDRKRQTVKAFQRFPILGTMLAATLISFDQSNCSFEGASAIQVAVERDPGLDFGQRKGKRLNMPSATQTNHKVDTITREELVGYLNEDLAGEYQAIISYVIYSQVLKGAEYMNIAAELEVHAAEELSHALIIANQIDYLGGMPVSVPKPVKTSEDAKDMLRFDLENENETIARYRQRIKQCESLGEFAIAEQIRRILVQEQDHQISLATALGISAPNVPLLP